MSDVRLGLLGGFELTCSGCPVALPLTAQRLLAFLAIHDRALQRTFVAGVMWSESSDDRSQASLRSAVWRLRRPGYPLIEVSGNYLAISRRVVVDVAEATALARQAADANVLVAEGDLERAGLGKDLLPDWYDDWVMIERERLRQLRLHALETLCRRLTSAGRYGDAVQAGLAAICGEPLRESAQRALIEAHLSAGNRWEAIRQFRQFAGALQSELGLEPPPDLRELMRSVIPGNDRVTQRHHDRGP